VRGVAAAGLIVLAGLTPFSPALAEENESGAAELPTGTVTRALQVESKVILVSLPNVCLDVELDGKLLAADELALQGWLEAVRLYRLPDSKLDPATPEKLATKAEPVFFEECFDEIRLTARQEIRRDDDYRVVVDGLDAGSNLRIVPGAVTLAPRELDLEFDRSDPFRLEVATPSCATGDEASYSVEASIPVDRPETEESGRKRVDLKRVGVDLSGEPPGPCRLVFRFDAPLRHDMELTVSGQSPIGEMVGSGKVSFPAPKDKKESELFVEVTAEAGEGQKPNLLIDFKFEREAAVYLGGGWTLGIDLGAEIATRDADETNKVRIGYPFSRRWLFATDRGVAGVYGHFAPRVEADDVFANRNVLADVSFDVLSTSLAWECWQRKCEVTPTLGYQWGENQRLEDEDLQDFEGYSVSRGMAEIGFALKGELESRPIKSFSFSVTYSGWYRFSRELDTFTDAEGESAVRLEDGYVDFWIASIDLRLSEAFGVVLKYQTGERPVLFKEEDKASLGISYRL